jgi:hypothetical protein
VVATIGKAPPWRWLSRATPPRSLRRSAKGTPASRSDGLSVRVAHLEAALEGLQDAVYRQAVLHDQDIAELRKRLDPPQMARDLSQDARVRGL